MAIKPVPLPPSPPGKGILKKTGTEKQPSLTGKTGSGQKIETVPPETVAKSIPAHVVSQGVKLSSRSVVARQPRPGLINRLMNFIRNRPNSAQRTELWNVFQNMERSLSLGSGNPHASDIESGANHLSVLKGSNGEKVAALMVNAGLARFSSKHAKAGRVAIEYIRPHNFEQQVRGMEALIEVCPLVLDDSGNLDWKAISQQLRAAPPPTVLNIPFLKNRSNRSGWFVKPQATKEAGRVAKGSGGSGGRWCICRQPRPVGAGTAGHSNAQQGCGLRWFKGRGHSA